MEKKINQGQLGGVFNHYYHQYIISDLIFGIRKKLVERKIAKDYVVISEISLSQLGYSKGINNFVKDHNIDLVVIEKDTKNIVLLIEIERTGKVMKTTKSKILQCINAIPNVEAYIANFDINGKVNFNLCAIINEKLVEKEGSSKIKFQNMILKSFITTKI